jgi:Ni,Fe-hydrogenase III large subunit
VSRDFGFTAVRNGVAIPCRAVAELEFADFRRQLIAAIGGGIRVSSLFGHADPDTEHMSLVAVLNDPRRGVLLVGRSRLTGDRYPSITVDCPQVHLFERELAEQFGLRPEGHPWLKPVRFHAPYRPGHDAWNRSANEVPAIGVMDFYRVEGDEVHEVAVGPVHAGIIEPGHFRFQCHGEEVFHLEISLGYQHRGVERSLVGGPTPRSIHTIETLAGDTSIGHGTAYCVAIESLAGTRPPARAEVLRGIALELERLANHTGDLGALSGDVAFLPTAAFCGRLRGDFLNLTASLCGSRFGRGFLRGGGVSFDLEANQFQPFLSSLDSALRDVTTAADLLWDSASVQARFEGTGSLGADDCQALGMVGPAARACGVEYDVRHDFPWGIFRYNQIPVSTWSTGDVFARAYVRWLEIQRAVEFIRRQVSLLPPGPVRVPLGELRPDHFVAVLVEGWRGEICHAAWTDATGRFARYKIVDPSFRNWSGLAMAMRNQQISDFPLCNKSFNLSYCGFDL